MEKKVLKTSKDNNVTIYIYDNVENPKAAIQIVHGASEHLTRYEGFIKVLNENGFICVGGDILGHGESTHDEKNIYFEKNEAFESIVMVKDYIKENYPDLQLYLFGHSMGSFLSRKLLMDYPKDYSKAIICGTTTMPTIITDLAIVLSQITKLFRGKKGISPLLSELGLNGLPKKMEKRNLLDGKDDLWITHDKEVQEYYKTSPICGEDFTVSAYNGMFTWVNYVGRMKNIRKTKKDMPLLFIAGGDDPLSNFGADIEKTCNKYKEAGCQYVKHIIYDGMRHEIHNEIERGRVYRDCIEFLNA